ncbi:hypothetical protein HK104_010549 [Borealophlyctis nickersoniae]|nr:hypothetical protein HK104_010549 [Borealophlyctis nickersoniae]
MILHPDTLSVYEEIASDRSSPAFRSLSRSDFSSLYDFLRDNSTSSEKLQKVIDDALFLGYAPTRSEYPLLVELYSIAGHLKGCLDIMARMREEGLMPSFRVYGQAVRCCLNARDAETAWTLFEQMRQQAESEAQKKEERVVLDAALMGQLLRTAILARNVSIASSFHSYCVSEKIDVNAVILGQLLGLLMEKAMEGINLSKDHLDKALNVYATMMERGFLGTVEPPTVANLVKALFDSDRAADAVKAFDAAKAAGVTLGPSLLSLMIEAAVKLGDFTMANSIYVEMKLSATTPTVQAYNSMLRHLCSVISQDKNEKLIRSILGEMSLVGFEPDPVTYNLVFEACKTGGHFKLAMKIYEAMTNRAILSKDTFDLLASWAVSRNEVRLSHRVLEDARKLNHTLQVAPKQYGTIIAYYRRTGDMDEAKKAFENMIAAGQFDPSEARDLFVSCLVKKDESGALQVFKHLDERKVDLMPVMYGGVLRFLARHAPQRAKGLYKAFLAKTGRITPGYWRQIVSEFVGAGEIEFAEKVLLDMEAFGVLPGHAVLNGVLRHHLSSDLERAINMVHSMLEKRVILEQSTYTALLERLLKERKYDDTLRIMSGIGKTRVSFNAARVTLPLVAQQLIAQVEEALEIGETLSDSLIKTLGAIRDAIYEKPEAGVDAYRRRIMIILKDVSGSRWNEVEKDIRELLPDILQGRSSEDQVLRAKSLYHKIIAFHRRPDVSTYERLLSAASHHRMHDVVVELHDEAVASGARPSTPIALVRPFRSLIELGRLDEAFALLQEMLPRGIKPHPFFCFYLIKEYQKRHRYEAANTAFELLRRFAAPLSAQTVAHMVGIKTRLGDTIAALELNQLLRNMRKENAEGLRDLGEGPEEFWLIQGGTYILIKACILEARWDEAKSLLEECPDNPNMGCFQQEDYLQWARAAWDESRFDVASEALIACTKGGLRTFEPAFRQISTKLVEVEDLRTLWRLYKTVVVDHDGLEGADTGWLVEKMLYMAIREGTQSSRAIRWEIENIADPELLRKVESTLNAPLLKRLASPKADEPLYVRHHKALEPKNRVPKAVPSMLVPFIQEKARNSKLAGPPTFQWIEDSMLENNKPLRRFRLLPKRGNTIKALEQALDEGDVGGAATVAMNMKAAQSPIPVPLCMQTLRRVLRSETLEGRDYLISALVFELTQSVDGRGALTTEVVNQCGHSNETLMKILEGAQRGNKSFKSGSFYRDLLEVATTVAFQKDDAGVAVALIAEFVRIKQPLPIHLVDVVVRYAAHKNGLMGKRLGLGLVEVWQELKRLGVPKVWDVFHLIARHFIQRKSVSIQAVEALMKQEEFSLALPGALDMILDGCRNDKAADYAKDVWRRAVDQGAEPSQEAYKKLVRAFLNGSDLISARNLLWIMDDQGHPQDEQLLNDFVMRCAEEGQVALAMTLMEPLTFEWYSRRFGRPPFTLRSCALILKYWAERQNHVEIRHAYHIAFYSFYKRERLRPILLNLVRQFFAEGRPECAAQLFRSIGAARKEVWDLTVHATMMDYFSQIGQNQKFDDTYAAVKATKKEIFLPPELFDRLIVRHARRRSMFDLQYSRRFFNDMVKNLGRLPSRETILTLVREHAASWDGDSAEIYVGLMNLVRMHPGLDEYNAVMTCWGRSGRTDRATRWLKKTIDRGLIPDLDTWFGVCWAFVVKKQLENVEMVFERMKGRGFQLDTETLLDELGEKASKDDMEGARRVWKAHISGEDHGRPYTPEESLYIPGEEGETRKNEFVLGPGVRILGREGEGEWLEHPALLKRTWVSNLRGTDVGAETGLMPPQSVLLGHPVKKSRMPKPSVR